MLPAGLGVLAGLPAIGLYYNYAARVNSLADWDVVPGGTDSAIGRDLWSPMHSRLEGKWQRLSTRLPDHQPQGADMEPIFDRNGRTVGWLRDDIVFDTKGHCRAFVQGGAIFTYGAKYLGTLHNGYFRDRWGNAVAFMKRASGRPIPPVPEVPPIPPLLPLAPLPPLPPLPPPAPPPSLNWSTVSWEELLNE